MKITRIETIGVDEFPNILFVRVHTDEGLIGLGETFWGPEAVAAYVHETVAPLLLGTNALHIEKHATTLRGFIGFQGAGVETRAASAIDIALWDLFGQATGQPLYQLLGGPSRDSVRVYNTCAGYQYVRKQNSIADDNWGLSPERQGPYEDLDAFLHRADELAASLLEEGITAMKIWPLDPYAHASGGLYISDDDLQAGLEPFRKIRRAVGNKIDVMVELHTLWNLPTAIRIAGALEEVQPFWFEDPIKMQNMDALAQFAASTHVPVTASETLSSRWFFREMFEKRVVVMA